MKVLFVCWGNTDGLSHWRSLVPARAMGADLLCFDMQSRLVLNDTQHELHEYDAAVVQTGWYDWQFQLIRRIQSCGVPTFINIDDWIRGIGRRARNYDTGLWHDFTKSEVLDTHDRMLRESDGILASTPVLASKLSAYNQVGLAPNGLDLHRYKPWRDPVRDDGFIIGWAGGIGHQDVIREISPAVQAAIADLNKDGVKAKLCVVGQDERDNFGVKKALYMRWADKMIYPQYLSCFDVSLAPSRDDSFYRYKSQLRLYEGAALGTPTLAGPLYDEISGYGEICVGDDWYSQIMRYGRNEDVRNETRQFCYDNVEADFSIESRIGTWETTIQTLLSGCATSDGPRPSWNSSRKKAKRSI